MRCRLRAGVALVVLGLMWGVLFLVPFAAPWIGFGVFAVWLCVFFVFCVGCFCRCLFFGVVFAFDSLCLGFCSLERDEGIELCISPLPVDFYGPTAWSLRELIN